MLAIGQRLFTTMTVKRLLCMARRQSDMQAPTKLWATSPGVSQGKPGRKKRYLLWLDI